MIMNKIMVMMMMTNIPDPNVAQNRILVALMMSIGVRNIRIKLKICSIQYPWIESIDLKTKRKNKIISLIWVHNSNQKEEKTGTEPNANLYNQRLNDK